MIKKMTLLLISAICVLCVVSTLFLIGKKVVNDIQEGAACNGRIQLTCGEKGCDKVCYPE